MEWKNQKLWNIQRRLQTAAEPLPCYGMPDPWLALAESVSPFVKGVTMVTLLPDSTLVALRRAQPRPFPLVPAGLSAYTGAGPLTLSPLPLGPVVHSFSIACVGESSRRGVL